MPGNTLRAILASILAALILIGIFRLILRSWQKAALATTGFLVLFFNYGHLYNLIQNHYLFGFNYGRHRVLFPIFILVFALLVFWISCSKELPDLTVGLNLIGVAILIFPLYQIISYQAKSSTQSSLVSQSALQTEIADLHLSPGVTPPDIYYIILDTYTRADTLKSDFSYDNSSFLSDLRARGFYVADCSLSNYSFTDLSLTTSLNFNYPETLNEHLSPGNKNISDAYPYLANNEVVASLHKLGYRFIALESGYQPTEFTHADAYLSPLGDWKSVLLEDGVTSFESMELNTSAGMLFYEFSSYLPSPLQKFLDASVIHRQRILYELNQLDQMASQPGPKFVFVHILAPHNPFVFGADGEYIPRKTPFSLNDDKDVVTLKDYVAGYRNQVTYLNQRILSVVDSLLENSATPPVILIQGDHGVPRLTDLDTTILNTYYLPGGGDAKLYQTITPVNSFRLIFNQYFSTHLPLLPDRSCNMNMAEGPFSCVPVTDPNQACSALAGEQKP